MSAKKYERWQVLAATALVTAVLTGLCYLVWTEANSLARMFARGTVLTDLRFFVGLLAVFVFLTLADRLIGFIRARVNKSD
jgi:hypothetical protein